MVCPDPIDFRAYTVIDLYADSNAYYHRELALGSGRGAETSGTSGRRCIRLNHFDLSYILKRDWKTLGPKLRGKLKLYGGEADNYYLNNAVYLVEEFLKTADPPAEAEVDYEARAEHCWTGDHTRPNATSRLRYH